MITLNFNWENPAPINKPASVSSVSLQLASIVILEHGTVKTVNDKAPDNAGNVNLTAGDIGADPAGTAANLFNDSTDFEGIINAAWSM